MNCVRLCQVNDPNLSAFQCEVMTLCALSMALEKFVWPWALNFKAAVSNSSGELVKSFSIGVDGSWLKKIKLYAFLLTPPISELRLTAACRAIQKMKSDVNAAPSRLFAMRLMCSNPAESGGCMSCWDIDSDLIFGFQLVRKGGNEA